MTTAVDHPTVIERLRPLLVKAVSQAALLGQPVLVSDTSRVRPADSVALFARSPAAERIIWEQPADAFSILGIGVAARLTGQGEKCLPTVAGRWRSLVSTAVAEVDDGCPVHPPLGMGGTGFDPRRRISGSPWEPFPDAELIVPRFQIVSHRGSFWLTVNVVVTGEQDVDAVADEADRALQDLLSGGELPVAPAEEVAAWPVNDDVGVDCWLEGVQAAITEIQRGTLEKVVLAREVRVRGAEAFDPAQAIRKLRSGYRSCTIFAFDTGRRCFLGATPERLVRLQDRRLDAACLAGSWRRGATDDEDRALGRALLEDRKERQEHELVVRAVRDALEPICSDLTIPETPTILDLPNVKHLYTPVGGRTEEETTVLDAVERLNPTPATGGLPREAALEFIRRFEGFDRGWYAGAVGWVDRKGGGEFAVSIRSALLRDDEAFLYAGCGIVADSDPQREYEESCVKLQPLRWALGLE